MSSKARMFSGSAYWQYGGTINAGRGMLVELKVNIKKRANIKHIFFGNGLRASVKKKT